MKMNHKFIIMIIVVFLTSLTSVSAVDTQKIFFQGNETKYDYAHPLDLGYALNSSNSSDGLIYISGIVNRDVNCGTPNGGCPLWIINSDMSLEGTILNRQNNIQYYMTHVCGDMSCYRNFSTIVEWNGTSMTFLLAIDTVNRNFSAVFDDIYAGSGTSTNNASADEIRYITVWNGEPDNYITNLTIYGFEHPSIIPATVDIKPDTLNLKSNGRWVTAYIELPEDYDVSNIYVSSILLEDIIPAESHPIERGDYDSDGIPDLMVKFNRTILQNLLKERNQTGYVSLNVTGNLNDGTSFEGQDTIRVIH